MITLKNKFALKTALSALFVTLCCYGAADVYISEFMADNDKSLLTADGMNSDWIELRNDSHAEVDISGWFLTDDQTNPTKWHFPTNTVIAADDYLIIFADGSSVSITNNELHANFKLSKNGEYLALVQPDGATVVCEFSPEFPTQYEDVGYGLTHIQNTIIDVTTPTRYKIPNASGTAPWHNATGSLGFTDAISTFTVNYYEINSGIASVDQAENMIADPEQWSTATTFPVVAEYAVINMHGSGGAGNFSNDDPFPNHNAVGVDKNWFVVTAEAAILIPAPGTYSFAVGSDDGFRLSITGQGQSFGSEHPAPRGFGTTVSAFNFSDSGFYTLNLIFFENTGGATLELSCASGSHAEFDAGAFKLIGAEDAPVRLAADIGSHINKDIRNEMRNVNSRLDAEWDFELPTTIQPNDTFTLALRYMDGCKIAVNGQSITSFNTPASLSWNSAATTSRSRTQGAEQVEIAVPWSALRIGVNTLSIIALNDSTSDSDFIIQPVFTQTTATRRGRYFPDPTPGAANGQYYTGATPKVTITVPRGYKSDPFTTELICINSPMAAIRYTLNGSVPDNTSRLYTQPLTISDTTILRAAVVDPQSFEQRTESVTWLFVEDILSRDASTPDGWPNDSEVNGHKMEYGLRADIVSGDPDRIRQGMTNDIPSISIVTDLKHLFNAQSGIYVNPGNDGRDWERPASIELIDHARGSEYEFQIDAGVRIRGAFSRSPDNPKHSFRLFFRSDYGDSKLRFNLFEDEGVDKYDNVDLRTAQNYSWSFDRNDSTKNTFAREVFARDTQRDMDTPHTRTRYYHLYLNGEYWGLYQTQERGNDNWAESYLGGKDDDYDCIKVSQPGYTLTASDGNFDAYHNLHNYAVNQGFTGGYSDNYWTVRGMDADGTINTNKPCYLDQDNLINYMLNCYYTADPDGPLTLSGDSVNNFYALYNRKNPAGFTWLRHDAEHSLGAHSSYGVNSDLTGRGSNLTAQDKFNPATLHIKLCAHPEYRMRFADLAYQHLFNGGALTAERCLERFQARISRIDNAIVGESARWGRGKTRAGDWIPACDTVLNSFLPHRTAVIVEQFKSKGWYPDIAPPLFSTNSATVPAGYQLRVNSEAAFYYTTDGSDPRETGGAINPNAQLAPLPPNGDTTRTLIAKGADWHYYDAGAEPPLSGSLKWNSPAYPDSSWASGAGILGFAGSSPQNTVATTTRRYVNGISGQQVTTTYFRKTFHLDTTDGISSLQIQLLRDDGVVIHINGVEVTRHNMPAGAISYSTYSAGVAGGADQSSYHSIEITDTSPLIAGENVIAVEVHQCNAGSSDLYMDLSLTAVCLHACSAIINIDAPLSVKARSYADNEWSALAQASFDITIPPQEYENLRVTELMYAPTDPVNPASAFSNDDFAWLELRNGGATVIDLNGVSFVDGVTHTFAPYELQPGARVVVAKNPAALHQRHPTNSMDLLRWSSGNLARRGETIALVTPAASNILTFTYSNAWYPETYNTDRSMVVVDTFAAESLWSTATNWRPGRAPAGTPGNPDAPVFKTVTMTSANSMTVNTEGLEGAIQLWYSEDLANWIPCPPQAWRRENDNLIIDIQSPPLPNTTKGFFQLRISD